MCHFDVRACEGLDWRRLQDRARAQAVPAQFSQALADAAVDLVRGTGRAYLAERLPAADSCLEPARLEAVLDRLLPREFLEGLRAELLAVVLNAMAGCTRVEYARAFGNPIFVMRTAPAFAGLRAAARALTAAAVASARARIETGFAHPRPKTAAGAVRLARLALQTGERIA
jgi:hypothetical protein